MKLIIFDNLFNSSEFFKIFKNTNWIIRYYYKLKLRKLVDRLVIKHQNDLDLLIITSDNKEFFLNKNIRVQLLSDYRTEIDHEEYWNLYNKVIQETRINMRKFLGNLHNLKTFHINGIFIGKIIEAYVANFLKEFFGEFEIVKKIFKTETFDKAIFFNVNPNSVNFLRTIKFSDIEIYQNKLLKLTRKLTVWLRFKHFFSLTMNSLKEFLKIRNIVYYSNKSNEKPNITLVANTRNQRHSIQSLFIYFKKTRKVNPIIYKNQFHCKSISEIHRLLKLIFQIRRIWLNNFNEITKNLTYYRLNLKNVMKELYSTHLFYFITRIYFSLLNFEKFVKDNQPSIVTVGNELSIDGRLNAKFCKLNNIPVVYIPHADIPVWDEIVTKTDFSYMTVPGKIGKQYMISKGEPKENIIITGRPSYDPFYEGKIKKLKNVKDMFTNKVYEFEPEKFTILLASNPLGDKAIEKMFMTVFNSLNELNILENLVIKLHPRENGLIYKKIFKNLGINPVIVRDINIFELIQSSSLLLAGISNTILESMIIGTPVVCLDFINIPFHSNGRYLFTDEKYIIMPKNQKSLTENIDKLLNNKEFYLNYSNKLRKLSVGFSFYNGKNTITEIIANTFIKIIRENKQIQNG